MPKISLYIPVFNGEDYLPAVLSSVFAQTQKFDEILVIDDCSTDKSLDVVKSFPVTYIKTEYHKGLAEVRNIGVNNTKYDFIASIDQDVELKPDWLETILKSLDDEELVGVSGKLIEPSFNDLADRWRAVNLIQNFGDESKEVSYLAGSNTIFRRSVFEQVGLYDLIYKRNHEDTELTGRMHFLDKKLFYCAEAEACHLKNDTFYSVMRSCWGFRHREEARSRKELVFSILRELKHAVSICLKSIFNGRFSFLRYDFAYFFIQSYFCIRSYNEKGTDF